LGSAQSMLRPIARSGVGGVSFYARVQFVTTDVDVTSRMKQKRRDLRGTHGPEKAHRSIPDID